MTEVSEVSHENCHQAMNLPFPKVFARSSLDFFSELRNLREIHEDFDLRWSWRHGPQ